MKRIGYLYEKIYDKKNIELAITNARRGKNTKEIQWVMNNFHECVDIIHRQLKNKTFVNSKYKKFIKLDKGKEREIFVLPFFPDRIIHHAIVQILEPIWIKILIKDTYQSIKGRGVHKAKKKLEYHLRKNQYKYCLKIDIKKFYPSIDNEILKQILRRKIKDKETLWLLDEIIDSTGGVPIGNYISQYFGNLYLAYFDHFCKETLKIKEYYRYCDDVTILSNNKEELHKILKEMRIYISTLNLKIKDNYQIFEIENRGIDFLGYRFFHNYTLIRKRNSKSFKKLLKYPSKETVAGIWGWCKFCNSFHFLNKYLKRKRI